MTALKTWKVLLDPSLGLDTSEVMIQAEHVREGAGGGLKFTTGESIRNRKTVRSYGPSAWILYEEVEGEQAIVSDQAIPDAVLAKVEKALNDARRFAVKFSRSSAGILSDAVRAEAQDVARKVSEAFTGLDPFLDDLPEDEDDDD